MKPVWNPLLIALGGTLPLSFVLLPVATPIAAAEPTPTSTPILLVQPDVVVPTLTPEKASGPENSSKPTSNPTAAPEASQIPSSSTAEPPSKPENRPDTTGTSTKEPSKPADPKPATEAAPSPEEVARRKKLIEADQLYLGGQYAAAGKLYQEVKPPFPEQAQLANAVKQPPPITDPAQLSPGGRVYWRESEAGLAQNLATRIFVPLKLLVEKDPEFIPGHLRLAQALKQQGHTKEALEVLERAATLYPNQPDLLKARIVALADAKQWMEASLAARQFGLLNPNDPAAPEFTNLADKNLQEFQANLRRDLTGNAIANFITGAVGYALTGSLYGPFSAVQSTAMLLQGESSVGNRVAEQAKQELELVDDKAVLNYVNEIGQRLAKVSGRSDFDYKFYVVMDDDLNAFALPGGKVFVNAGAIALAQSEAELAGLLAHELSHALLSHGFQLMTEGNLTANLTQYVPLGGAVANLLVLNYSRDMERQADLLGTRLLASTGYAADGLRNLMVTFKKEDKQTPFSWLSSHPVTDERISYLESLIQRGGYNRYAYEGVGRHAEIQAKVKQLLAQKQQKQKE